MEKAILFWALVGVTAFAFALSVQMRVLIALVLRRALRAWNEEMTDPALANGAVVAAARRIDLPADANPAQETARAHLLDAYQKPLMHLRLAQRVSVITPVLILALLALGRLVWGVI